MAGGADGQFRRGIPAAAAGGDPHHHPDQPEVLRGAPLPPPLAGEGRGGGRGAQTTAPTLANKFILVANIEASDGGTAIIAGNERVIRARLADAKFFYETDLKTRLEDRLPKFRDIVFHEKLGAQAERIDRIERLAAELAPLVGADVEKTKRAARLAKADLLTEMVGEFPELQGLMGKCYATPRGRTKASRRPARSTTSRSDRGIAYPLIRSTVAVALADKLDTLVGFWAIDEKPTGSKDPVCAAEGGAGGDSINFR